LTGLRAMLVPWASELRSAIGRLEYLCDVARVRGSTEVLCHTDIWGSNLLQADDGTLHLLDWNGALLGPPENDLFMFAGTVFFPADRFGWFLGRYEATAGHVPLDAQRFGFYFYRRNLEDLASFVESIATGQRDMMDSDAMLRVVADLLAELPRLERRIEHVSGLLARAG
jgi:aminoglycoside phosphotransferase (APT) family kinase protein